MGSLHFHRPYHHFFIRISVVALALFMSLLVGQGSYLVNMAHAQSTMPTNYSCGNLSGNHCYAFYEWYGGMNGSKTDITVPFLGGRPGSDGFMNWETWIGQSNNPGCTLNGPDTNCWIEAGITDSCCTLGEYFWADERPGGGYHNHFENQVGPDDYVEEFQIYRVNSTTWNVSGSVVSCGGTFSGNWGGQSTANSYSPNYIRIGAELAGSYGQKGPGADWTNNYWRCGSSWCPQTGLGNPGSGTSWSYGIKEGPLTGGWNIVPSSSSTGDWFAYCASC